MWAMLERQREAIAKAPARRPLSGACANGSATNHQAQRAERQALGNRQQAGESVGRACIGFSERKPPSSAAAIGLVMFATPSFAHDQAEAQKAVDTFSESYARAFDAKDAAGIVAMFAADGVEASPGPILTSRDDIEKWFKTIFAIGFTDLQFEIKQVQAEGNIVFAAGQFTVKTKDNRTIQHLMSGDGVMA